MIKKESKKLIILFILIIFFTFFLFNKNYLKNIYIFFDVISNNNSELTYLVWFNFSSYTENT